MVVLNGENIAVSMNLEGLFTDKGTAYTISGVTSAGLIDQQKVHKDGASLKLGNESSNLNIAVTARGTGVNNKGETEGLDAIGLWAYNQYGNSDKSGGQLQVDGKQLEVNVHSENGFAYGALAQNSSTQATATPATLVINAENTIINVTSGGTGTASGLVAMSQGILKVNGNLEVNADDAIVARGKAVVRVNSDDNGNSLGKTVRLNGDIDFNYDKETSGTGVDADVLVNLTGADSVWNGNAKVTWGTGVPEDEKKDVSGLKLNLSDGAQWNPTVITSTEPTAEPSGTTAIAINNLGLNDGVINIKTAGQEVKVENLSGTGGTINAAAQKEEDGKLTSAKLQVGQVDPTAGTPHLAVNYQGIDADDLGADTAAAMTQLA
ncbi:hypothetical protein NAI82_11455, partial [Oxalobacter sp. JAC-2022]|uniref:hypothetical protein n=1 Tax=Oxalobacter aliiformigenes TaxID=2946593 RepID=UPI0022AF9CE4